MFFHGGFEFHMMGTLVAIFFILLVSVAKRIHSNILSALISKILHQKATEALKLSEERFETIFKDAPAGIFYYNTDLIVVETNNEMIQILKISRERMIGLDLKKLIDTIRFKQKDFVEKVIRIVAETGIVPSMLELELTESIIIDKIDTVIDKMNRLRRAGISLSMDDFGTGYSSLAYLKKLPFTTLKIDRSFIRDIMSDADDAVLVETILSMASIFRLDVIAEGVEVIEQFEFLKRHGCQFFQGYLCSKPVQAKTFEELLNHDIQSCSSSA